MGGPTNKDGREEVMTPGFEHEIFKGKDHLELLFSSFAAILVLL
jgi:hypothetical protein